MRTWLPDGHDVSSGRKATATNVAADVAARDERYAGFARHFFSNPSFFLYPSHR